MPKDILIIGAGVVGICCAIECLKTGSRVTLVDRDFPAKGASFGNAGIIHRGGILPYASAYIRPKLIHYALNRDPRFILHWPHIFKLLPWLNQFWANCNQNQFEYCIQTLDFLLKDSTQLHFDLVAEASIKDQIKQTGWLHVYRNKKNFMESNINRKYFDMYSIDYELLNKQQIQELEPALNPVYYKGMWLKAFISANDPYALCLGYFGLFKNLGGKFIQQEVQALTKERDKWQIVNDQARHRYDKVVIACGAQSAHFIRQLKLPIPLALERGYHLMYPYPCDQVPLGKPVLDSHLGMVFCPMEKGIRVTSGVNLTAHETRPTAKQILSFTQQIEQVLALAPQTTYQPWLGNRPSTPDALPVIGAANKINQTADLKDLYLAFGHGHLGLTLGPRTGKIIADLIHDRVHNPAYETMLNRLSATRFKS